MESRTTGSRRDFLSAVALTAGGAIIPRPLMDVTANSTDPRATDIAATTIGIDTHNHIDVPLSDTERPAPDIA